MKHLNFWRGDIKKLHFNAIFIRPISNVFIHVEIVVVVLQFRPIEYIDRVGWVVALRDRT